jgi:hypothetical protein
MGQVVLTVPNTLALTPKKFMLFSIGANIHSTTHRVRWQSGENAAV